MSRRTKRSRLRRPAKWAGLVVCVLIAAAWCVSIRWGFFYGADVGVSRTLRLEVGIVAGTVAVAAYNAAMADLSTGWNTLPVYGPMIWWPVSLGGYGCAVPLWIILGICLPPTAWLWWRDRKPRSGHCACGYSLAGLAPGAPCPECGKAGS